MDLIEFEHKIKTELEGFEYDLSEEASPESGDIEEIVGYGMKLSAIIGSIGRLQADSEKLLNKKELIFMNEHEDMWEKPTVLKKLMTGTLADYYYYVLLADRLSSACTHKMDFYRSILSKYKEELRLSLMQPNQGQQQG